MNPGEAVQECHDLGSAINPADPQLRELCIFQLEVDGSRVTPLIQGVSERHVPQDNAPFAPCQDGGKICLCELDALIVDECLLAGSQDCLPAGQARRCWSL